MKQASVFKKILLSGSIMTLLTTCTNPSLVQDPYIDTLNDAQVVQVSGILTGNEIWGPPNTYILNGMVVVPYGKTLCIEPGTIIKASDKLISGLHVERGGTLCANGTAQNPIVFTTSRPAGSRNHGDWYGISICGYASNTIDPDAELKELINFEHFFNIQYGEGGGLDPHLGIDPTQGNMGTSLQFVRIEYTGYPLSPNVEGDGLILASVGPHALIDHVMVTHSSDDSYSFRGGSFSAKHLISHSAIDDDFELSDGFNGRLQYAFVLRDPTKADQSLSHAIEIKNTFQEVANTNTLASNAVLSNFTIIGASFINPQYHHAFSSPGQDTFRSIIDFRQSNNVFLYNSILLGFGQYTYKVNEKSRSGIPGPRISNSVIVQGISGFSFEQHNVDTSALLFQTDSFIASSAFGLPYPMTTQNTLMQNSNLLIPKQIATSPYLNGAAPIPGFDQVNFLGAMGSTDGNWNWNTIWIDFNPQHNAY